MHRLIWRSLETTEERSEQAQFRALDNCARLPNTAHCQHSQTETALPRIADTDPFAFAAAASLNQSGSNQISSNSSFFSLYTENAKGLIKSVCVYVPACKHCIKLH